MPIHADCSWVGWHILAAQTNLISAAVLQVNIVYLLIILRYVLETLITYNNNNL